MYHIIAKNKDGTEAYAEEIKRVHPVGDGIGWFETASGGGFFGYYDDMVVDADIIKVCAGGSIVKIRLKGEDI